jgi:aryl-alcohol dehydrogenase-like predicted oxidoreductase
MYYCLWMKSRCHISTNSCEAGSGTVQFGLDYGISNNGGKTAEEEVARILDLAVRKGIRYLDTASQYGNSEEVLGSCLPRNHVFLIVTKTPRFGSDQSFSLDALLMEETFNRSLQHLGSSSVYGLMIHHADAARQKQNTMAENGRIKKRSRKQNRYQFTAKQIDAVLGQFPRHHPTACQCPGSASPFSGHLSVDAAGGNYARSVFAGSSSDEARHVA